MQKTRNFLITALAIGVLGLTAACGSDSGGGDDNTTTLPGLASCTAQTGSAVICGTALAADGTTPVAGAEVKAVGNLALVLSDLKTGPDGLLAQSAGSSCVTDDVGAFACLAENCDGDQTFTLIGSLFGSSGQEFSATCDPGSVTNVSQSATTASGSSNVMWLVIPGSFDGIQLLLSQLKGCTLTGDESVPAALRGSTDCENKGLRVLDDGDVVDTLTNDDLTTYQAIFANCDADFSFDDSVTAALQAYVNGGGNMYFSDLADSWLTTVFPDPVTFPTDKNATSAGTLTGMDVDDTGLQIFLGSTSSPQTTMDIIFDLGVWTAMESVIASWTTFISGDISPLAPTLTGDRPITVGGPQEDGCVFYTSYHVEGGAVGSDQEEALRYLVLNRMNNCT